MLALGNVRVHVPIRVSGLGFRDYLGLEVPPIQGLLAFGPEHVIVWYMDPCGSCCVGSQQGPLTKGSDEYWSRLVGG